MEILSLPGRRVLVATRVTRRFAIGKLPVLTPHRGVIHYARAALLRRPLRCLFYERAIRESPLRGQYAYGVKEKADKDFRLFQGDTWNVVSFKIIKFLISNFRSKK